MIILFVKISFNILKNKIIRFYIYFNYIYSQIHSRRSKYKKNILELKKHLTEKKVNCKKLTEFQIKELVWSNTQRKMPELKHQS